AGAAILPRQELEGRQLVGSSQVDLDLMRRGWSCAAELGVPEGAGVAVDGIGGCPVVASGFLAVDEQDRPARMRDQAAGVYRQRRRLIAAIAASDTNRGGGSHGAGRDGEGGGAVSGRHGHA